MEPLDVFRQLAISTLLGLLVGLQRERTESNMAGIRTFPLITVFGTLCALLSQALHQNWILPAGLIALASLFIVGNLPKLREAVPDPGVTTEMAILVMFADGALVAVAENLWIVAVAIAGSVAILLQLKPEMHGLASRMGEKDFKALMQFVLITFIVLPVLPNQAYDPFDPLRPLLPANFGHFKVLNPYEVWLMVVLVVGISFGGYLLYKMFGQRVGLLLGGLIGGMISSTAVTVSYSRRTKGNPELAGQATIAILIATTVSFLRVLLEVGVVAPSFLPKAFYPIVSLAGVAAVLSLVAWVLFSYEQCEMPEHENPTELKSAIVFALVYAVVLVAVAVGRYYFENKGLYVVAVISGMTDMDAITLSTSRLVKANQLLPEIAWRLVLVGSLSNTLFKAAVTLFMGHKRLFSYVAGFFSVILVAGLAIVLWWPV